MHREDIKLVIEIHISTISIFLALIFTKEISLGIKLLVTIGPSSFNKNTITEMEKNGVDLFKINLSHTKISDVEEVITSLKAWSSVPVCLDSEGAQVRNQYMEEGSVAFKEGDTVKVHPNEIKGDNKNISFAPNCVYSQLIVGDLIYVDFHAVTLKVIEKQEKFLQVVLL